ncbi:MAG: chemotaxis protein CheA [Polyangiaceae bacterium]
MTHSSVSDTFVAESHDLLDQLESGLIELEAGQVRPDLLDAIFRAAHTIKGGAGLVGERAIVEVAHCAENALDALRRGKIHYTPGLVRDMLAAVDAIRTMVGKVELGESSDIGKQIELCQRLSAHAEWGNNPEEAPQLRGEPKARIYQIQMKFSETLLSDGVDPRLFLDELAGMGDVVHIELDTARLPPFEALDPTRLYLNWTLYLRTKQAKSAVEATFLFVWSESEIVIGDVTENIGKYVDLRAADRRVGELLVESGHISRDELESALGAQKRVGEILVERGSLAPKVLEKTLEKQNLLRNIKRATSLRVDASKVDRLLNLVGELVTAVSQSSLVVMNPDSKLGTRRAAMEQLERITRDMQDGVTQMRTVPIDELFNRFPRTVRDIASQLGKRVELVTVGGESELDRSLVEHLVDPLKHMIRNCLDHGIEPPETRLLAGKPAKAKLTLSAVHRDGKVVITVSDDGRGIQTEEVRRKAIALGWVLEDEVLAERQIHDFLFRPGFSTATSVSELSGRGVGLDVVRRNVEELGGDVEIESRPGQGTDFFIRLPLTLAIIDALVVRLGQERIAFPLLNIVELIYPKPEDLRAAEGSRWLIRARGNFVPMAKLGELFGMEAKKVNPMEAMVIILGNEGHRFGIMVDDAVGTYQIVVKSLNPSFEVLGRLDSTLVKPGALAGAAVLPDGVVALIVDVFGLERMAIDELHRVRRHRDAQNQMSEVGQC